MRKAEIVERIAAQTDLTKTKAEEAVEAVLAVIKDMLRQGEPVILRGLGTFAVRAKGARLGRNPKTGTAAEISARRVVRFTAGKLFKQAAAAAATPEELAPPSPPAAPGRSTRCAAQAASPTPA
jgi:nucleoid DNA-binding protein